MKSIILEQSVLRKRMLELIRQDPFLGYNPESADYKYDANTIRRGLRGCAAAERDVHKAAELLRKGKFLLPNMPVYTMGQGRQEAGKFRFSIVQKSETILLEILCYGINPKLDEFFIAFDDTGFSFPKILHMDSSGKNFIPSKECRFVIKKRKNDWHIRLAVSSAYLSGMKHNALRIQLTRLMGNYQTRFSWPATDLCEAPRINLAFYQPRAMGRLLFSSACADCSKPQFPD